MIQLSELVIRIPVTDTTNSSVSYKLDSSFFKLFPESLLDKTELDVCVILEKTAQHIQLLFLIKGEVELYCDRTLENFNYPINIEQKVYFKLGDENKELDVDLYMLERVTTNIPIAQHIYDFVNLSIPMKRLYPRFSSKIEN